MIRARGWLWPVLVILLLLGHGLILGLVTAKLTWPAALVAGAVLVLGIKHRGLLGPVFTRLRRGSSHES
jgi:integral membrane sensor domain MASE1